MPNWVTNYVEIKCEPEKLNDLVARVIREEPRDEDTETVFDFNGIVPMPEELNIQDGSDTDLGLACFRQEEFDRYQSYPWFAEKYPNIAGPKELKAVLEKEQPRTVELGRQVFENLQKLGYKTWYDWSIGCWGSKWNAADAEVLRLEPGRLVVRFDTAWSTPDRVFDKLVADGFEVSCFWDDEGGPSGEYGNPWNAFDRRIEYEVLD